MSEENVVRRRKTDEEKIEAIDMKIAKHENEIAKHQNEIQILEQKKDAILHPVTYKTVLEEAKKRKITPKKLAELIEAIDGQFSDETEAE